MLIREKQYTSTVELVHVVCRHFGTMEGFIPLWVPYQTPVRLHVTAQVSQLLAEDLLLYLGDSDYISLCSALDKFLSDEDTRPLWYLVVE